MRKRLLALHAEAAAWFQENLFKSPDRAKEARKYLKSREFQLEVAQILATRLCPGIPRLPDRPSSQQDSFSFEEITQSGLAIGRDDEPDGLPRPAQRLFPRFRGRIMFPIRNDYGEVIAFSGRLLDPEAKTAKYVNSPETPCLPRAACSTDSTNPSERSSKPTLPLFARARST